MPVNNDRIPPLSTRLNIDPEGFNAMHRALELGDRVIDNLDFRLFSINFLSFNIADNFRVAADEAERLTRALAGAQDVQPGQLTAGQRAFPIGNRGGNVNVNFPSSFDEEEGFLEFSNQFREFYYGGDHPGFFNTFAGRALLYGGTGSIGLGAGLAGGSFLPSPLQQLTSDTQRTNDIKEAVKQGTIEAWEERRQRREEDGDLQVRGTQAIDEAATVADAAGYIPPGVTSGTVYGGYLGSRAARGTPGYVQLGRLDRLRLIGRGFQEALPSSIRGGSIISALGHAGYYWSPEDYQYARENDTSLISASFRRAIPNSAGASDFHDLLTGRETGVPFLLPSRGSRRFLSNLFATPAEGAELSELEEYYNRRRGLFGIQGNR